MVVNLIVALAMYISLPLIWWMLRSASFERSNLILSVTLPPEGRKDPQVLELASQFRRRLRNLFWAMTLVLVPAVLVPWVSVCTLYSLLWLIAALILPYALFAKANGRLRQLKQDRGWRTAAGGRSTVVAMPPAAPPKRLSAAFFLPPVLLSAAPALSLLKGEGEQPWNLVLLITVGCCLLVTVLSLFIYPLVFRQRLDALDEDETLTTALTRVRRYNWTKCWLAMSWCTGVYSLTVWGCRGSMAWYLIWTTVYSLILLGIALQTEFSARRAQRALTLGRQEAPLVDEDDRWLWGILYYNPDDSHTFVNERVGIGMSMNLARPAGKWMMGIGMAIVLAMPLLGVWLMVEEFSPLELALEQNMIVARQAFTTYEIPLDRVKEAELLDGLPAASRIYGSGLENLLKGKFTVEGYGASTLCLNPNDPPFLVLETSDATYILGGGDPAELYQRVT